ncbi:MULTISPECIES: rhamnogalacturonan acetylesterase [unclassified Paraflavitalea]|uniref:rhamnogalacturonan acetylesterase n=1 Tax=unclassified Paraflavitalea TaxID=2798305 RepID=UPI003D343E9C
MKAKWLVLLVGGIALSSFSWWQEKKITLFMAGDSTMSIKETKAYPETGWGMPFVYFWDSSVTVVNKAKNGRSTKTFISEGLWKSICDNIKPGDYVFIQFGHNDEAKDKVERYTTPEEYTTNLLKFVNETKAKQGIPVLLTPVSRRRFDKEGKATETHTEYSALVRTLAAKENVLMIDLDKLSMDLYQQFGAENSKWLFLQLQPNEHPNYPEGKNDNTHFNELGARLVAQLVLSEIKKQIPELAAHLVKPVVKK